MGEIFEKAIPQSPLEWTGERLTSGITGQIEIEHLHRYMLARDFCRALDVLDIASGEGYGSALLAQTARSVIGVEIAPEAVDHASKSYQAENLEFRQGDARRIPVADESIDIVVSFETLEHFYEHDAFLSEVRRILRPGGRLIISSPDRDIYSPPGSPANPYHVRELSRQEFEALLQSAFAHVHILSQRPLIGSALIADEGIPVDQFVTFEKRGPTHYEGNRGLPRPTYLVAIASNETLGGIPNSLFIETGEVGAILSHAQRALADDGTELAALRSQLLAVTEAEANARLTVDALRKELEVGEEVKAALEAKLREETDSQTSLAALEAKLEAASRELFVVSQQRDVLRASLQRRVSTANDVALLQAQLEQNAKNSAEQVNALLEQLNKRDLQLGERDCQIQDLKAASEHWQQSYLALRGRLERLLRKSGLLAASRLLPPAIRRSMKKAL